MQPHPHCGPGSVIAADLIKIRMIEVSAAIVIDGDRVLCFRKGESKRPYLSYRYEFPGGKLEAGESPYDALARELMEELSLDIGGMDTEPFADLSHNYSDQSVLIHYFLVHSDSPQYVLKEHVSASWTHISGLEGLDWAGADLDAVKLLEAGRR